MRQGASPSQVRVLSELFEVDARTIARWQVFWREQFPQTSFWKVARGQLTLLTELATPHLAVPDVGDTRTELLATVLGLAGLRAYRLGRSSGDGTLFASLVFAMVWLATSGDRLIDRPKELWFLFWFPVAIVIAAGPAAKARGAKTVSPEA